jgi:hypothetical protein
MPANEPYTQTLHRLLDALNKEESEAARQLIGMSLFLGSTGLPVLRHFLDSLLLFGLGRLLVLFLEWIGMPADEVELIHKLSKWYEAMLFSTFAVFSLIDIYRARFGRHNRQKGEPA